MSDDFWTYIYPLDGWDVDTLDGAGAIAVVWTGPDYVALAVDPYAAYTVGRADLDPLLAKLTQTGVLPLADFDAVFDDWGLAVAALVAAWPGVTVDGSMLHYAAP